MTKTALYIPGTTVGMDSSRHRVVGLDSIRFICAFIVMLGHIGVSNVRFHGSEHAGLTKIAIGIYNELFNGPAAVIVFFIVSGFCIHFPFSKKQTLNLSSFYCRRFIRIVLPAIAFLLFRCYALADRSSLQDSVLWSVICEIIYYLLYPVLLYLRRRSNWLTLIVIAYCTAAILIATHLSALSFGFYGYISLGVRFTWILGLPCWILGCWLAENYHSFPVLSVTKMWLVRVGIYSLTILLEMIRFHVRSPLTSNCIMLDLFAIPACIWLGFEIAYASQHARIRSLEWAGTWSYSLYLVHPLVPPFVLSAAIFPRLSLFIQQQQTRFFLLLLVLIASYGFFLLVEHPSHRLAVAMGRLLHKPKLAPPIPLGT